MGRKTIAAMCLLAAGLSGASAAVAFDAQANLSLSGILAILAGLSSMAAALLIGGRRRDADVESLAEHHSLDQERRALASRRTEIEQFQVEIEQQLMERSRRLDSRELALADRLVKFSEWLEYPQPEGKRESTETGSSPRELSEKDRRVLELIEAESKQLYRRLREGRYKPDGKIESQQIREDLVDFIGRVARVYRPDSENPLLETSVGQLLRAGSRTCLHLLVVIERLPLRPQDQTISALHGYLQKALMAYDFYTAAQPYLGYVRSATYFGRWFAGASPLTLGVTWALSEIGTRGAKAAANWLVDQQAVALLNDVVRVVGFEVASIYSGDFRHRDPIWVYAAELTNLISHFPLSRENLAQALREVGNLPFRNEYDRIYLYRCLSAHREPRPLANAHEFLSLPERQGIARRIETFFQSFIHGRTARRLAEWRAGIEQRLALQLTLPEAVPDSGAALTARSTEHDLAVAIRSLGAFLIGVKGCPIDELAAQLALTNLFQQLGSERQQGFLLELREDLPELFESPDLDPASQLTGQFIVDLCRLAVRAPPREMQADEVVLETAVLLGQDYAKTKRLLEREYVQSFESLFAKSVPQRKCDARIAKAVLSELRSDEMLHFAYGNAAITWPTSATMPRGERAAGLIGTSSRVLAIEVGDQGAMVAAHDPGRLVLERVNGVMVDSCRISGPAWSVDGVEELQVIAVQVSGSMGSRFDSYFKPLLDSVRNPVE